MSQHQSNDGAKPNTPPPLCVDLERLMASLRALGAIGALPGGGVKRLALTDEDKAGRDHLVAAMRALGLEVNIDVIGNIVGTRPGRTDDAAVVIGSHIDTVATGGLYDGALGVLAGLEVVAVLNAAEVVTDKPIAVAAFTNEEGSRFAPDMMGSGTQTGALDLSQMLATVGIDGAVMGDELARIGYAGPLPPGSLRPSAFIELHIEQGPILEREGVEIGVVEGVQGISWTEFTVRGTSNHAGTTPMDLRRDAGLVAAQIACLARAIADEAGPPQVATVGALSLSPGLVNVVAETAVLTVDLRHTREEALKQAEEKLREGANRLASAQGCTLETRELARFAPVVFDRSIVETIENGAHALGLGARRMPSGAGHDAQMFAPICPTGMIFVPSHDGLSHNVNEHTEPHQIEAGANLLLRTVLTLASHKA